MVGISDLAPLLFVAALALSGCNSAPRATAPTSVQIQINAPPVSVPAAELPGNWGFASYHIDTDRDRTVVQARGACSNPYEIGAGSNGGVIMYLADQNQPSELFVKVDSLGRSFIGPKGPPGLAQDRVVLSFDSGVLITDWLDPSAKERFGTMVFARCA